MHSGQPAKGEEQDRVATLAYANNVDFQSHYTILMRTMP